MPWSMLFRNVDTHPFAAGETVRLPHVEVTVLSVTLQGNPVETKFVFDEPLEQAADWRIWNAAGFNRFPVPEVGESVRIPESNVFELTIAVLKACLQATG